jgi:hypothetical protein
MAFRTTLLSVGFALVAATAQAQVATPPISPPSTSPPSTISPPPSPLIESLAPGVPQSAVFATPGPVMEITPDIADQFRAEVSAVVGSGAASRVLLSHPEVYGRAGRSLKIGDVYQDGWKIVSLTPKAVGLARSGQTRLVDLTVADKASLAANAAMTSQAAQKTVVTMAPLGLNPQPPAVPSSSDAGAAEPAAGIDPTAVAALVQALIVLGAQGQ